MHGSEIQAKYGNGAWNFVDVCTVFMKTGTSHTHDKTNASEQKTL